MSYDRIDFSPDLAYIQKKHVDIIKPILKQHLKQPDISRRKAINYYYDIDRPSVPAVCVIIV